MLNWGIKIFLISSLIVAGVWTAIPTSLLPWGAHKDNLLGYTSHCSFVPVSTTILLGLAFLMISKRVQLEDLSLGSYVVLGMMLLITFVGILTDGIGIATFVQSFLGITLGVILGTLVESIRLSRGGLRW
jgi:hypothetical protein